MDMYADIILDHYKNPHNYGVPNKRDAERRESNPLCGDVITVYLTIENNMVEDVHFVGSGCAISKAAASLLTDEIKGKTLDEIKKLDKQDALELLGIEISPARMKCALLGLKTLKLAIHDYMIKQGKHAKEKDFQVKDA
ncbi:MAG: Fe-S cluster assembly sulfur transfer protein SufU [Candidatus Aenigmatarchaeota archaeon]